MKKLSITVLSIAFILFGCNQNAKKENKEGANEVSTENTSNWVGVYKGILPSASCPGVFSVVKLNSDKTFEKSDIYLESKDGYTTSKGTFSFNADNSKITLNSENESSIYAVNENNLTLLDKNGDESTSELAKMYELAKMSGNDFKFTDKPVKGFLTLVDGISFEPFGSSKVYRINDFKGNKLPKLYNEKIKSQEEPYMPIVAELVVKSVDILDRDSTNQDDNSLDLVEIKSVELITPDNYSKK